jgi:hypothetical protein
MLLKLPIVPHRDNGPLGVNLVNSIIESNNLKYLGNKLGSFGIILFPSNVSLKELHFAMKRENPMNLEILLNCNIIYIAFYFLFF